MAVRRDRRSLPRIAQIRRVAMREIRARVVSRAFLIGTVLTVLVVIGAVVVPSLLGGKSKIRVAIVQPVAMSQLQVIDRVGAEVGANIEHSRVQSVGAGEAALRAHKLDLLVEQNRLVTLYPVSRGGTSTLDRYASAVSGAFGLERVLALPSVRALAPTTVKTLLSPPPIPIHSLAAAPTSTSDRALATFGLVFSFMLISLYNGWVLIGVIEEKSSRVVEVLLSVLKPSELLIGKVVGIGLVALVQGAVLVATALVTSRSVSSNLLTGSSVRIIVVFLVATLVGYALYSILSGAVGSLVSRMEDAQSVSIVIQLPLLVGYLASFATLAGSTNGALKILAFIPFTAPMVAPSMYASQALSGGSLWLALASTLVGIVVLSYLGSRIYAGAVMRFGTRVRLKDAMRSSRGSAVLS
ncbi:MAG: ABC transporter permease [Acidimicrobiales bacterium]